MNEFLYSILAWINSWVGSWGWSMVVFTIMIRLVLTPFDVKSRVSMRKTQKIAPMQQALQKKYANDKDKLNQKMAELYKKEHINPLSSCLPMLLTWPVLIAVFAAMRMVANKELLIQVGQILNNQAPNLEPWLWIKNVWMPDSIFASAFPNEGTLKQIGAGEWLEWFNNLDPANLPALMKDLNLTAASFEQANLGATIEAILTAMKTNTAYAEAVSVNGGWTFNLLITQLSVVKEYNGYMLLPILSAATQILMTKIMSGGQPQANDQAAATGKFMQWFFPIFSLVLCFSYSSAFALYWVAGNVVSMVQTFVINKVLDSREQANAVAGEGTVK